MIVVQRCWRSLTAAAKSCSLPPAGPVTDTPHGTIMDTLWENFETHVKIYPSYGLLLTGVFFHRFQLLFHCQKRNIFFSSSSFFYLSG